MTTQDMDILARKIVSLEKRHNSLARAQQLPNSSVRLVDGDDVGLADSAEATKDIGDEAAYLGDWLTDADNNLDDNAEYGVEVPEWIQDAGHAGDVAWDSTQFATDLALTLDTELTQAQQELEQAQIDLTQALADSATALQEAQQALQEAEDATTAAGNAAAAASAAQTAANNAQTAAGTAQDAADQAAQDALAATNTANTAQNTADVAQTTANAKGKVIIQSAAPDASDRLPQNLWIDTTGGANTPKRWSGSVWVAVTDKAATDAAAAAVSAQNRADDAYDEAVAAATVAGNAQAAANGKNRVWYQATAPTGTGHNVGDTWFNTGDSNKISRWNGSAWTATLFGTNAIDNLAITNALIADATIQNAKIANLDAAKITTGYLAAARIQAGTIVADKLASGAVVADKIATNAITAEKIMAGAVTSDKIIAGAITTDKIVAGAITGDKLVANAITGDKIVANAISGDKLQATSIDGMNITGAVLRGGEIYGGMFSLETLSSVTTLFSDNCNTVTSNWRTFFGDSGITRNTSTFVSSPASLNAELNPGGWLRGIQRRNINVTMPAPGELSFWVRPAINQTSIFVGSYAGVIEYQRNLPANTWTQVTIPLNQGASISSVKMYMGSYGSHAPDVSFSIDDMRITAEISSDSVVDIRRLSDGRAVVRTSNYLTGQQTLLSEGSLQQIYHNPNNPGSQYYVTQNTDGIFVTSTGATDYRIETQVGRGDKITLKSENINLEGATNFNGVVTGVHNRGTALERAATTPKYFDFWHDTDTNYTWVGNKSGGWRRYSGYAYSASAGWAFVANPIFGRTVTVTIPTVIDSTEQIAVSGPIDTNGWDVLSLVSTTRNATNTTLTLRFLRFGNSTTTAIGITWYIVPGMVA